MGIDTTSDAETGSAGAAIGRPACDVAARGMSAGVGAGGSPDGSAGDAVGRVADLVETLLAGLRSLDGELLEDRLGLVGRCESGIAAVKSETVAELARRDGEAGAAETVHNRLRQSRGRAKRDVKLAGQLAELPDTAQALADGDITPQHAKLIADAAEHASVDEAELLAAAELEPTDVFGRTVRDHVNDRSGDDLEERRRRQRAQREVSISRQSDGMYKLFGTFDPVAGARIETALAAAARKLRRAEDPKNRATVPQRFADALELLVTRHGWGKTQGSTLVVVADYDVVSGQLVAPHLADGTPLAASELVRLALEAKILPALFDTDGQPLWLGRESRDASAAQRIALAVRDKGCVGCGAANSWCQPHHIRHWEHGGPTDLDNLCLLCSDCHHRQVHTNGARVTQGPNGRFRLRHDGARQPVPGVRAGTTRHASSANAGGTISHPLRR